MRSILTMALLGLGITITPAAAQTQTPGVGQALQGLLSGNQNQDQAIRDAYERGYGRGRDDEARRARDAGGTGRSERRSSRSSDEVDDRSDRRR